MATLGSFLGAGAGAATGRVVVELIGDDRHLDRTLASSRRNVATSATAMERSVGRVGTATSKFGAVAKTGFLLAGAAIGSFVSMGVKALIELEKVNAQTAAGIESTGGAANVTAQDVRGLSARLEEMTAQDEIAIQTGANLLLTFTKVRNEVGEGNKVFDRATEAAVDLSVRGFGSIESASKMLGKALNDPVKGITAMSRAGVTFTQQQKDQIKVLVETNRTLDAQKLILAEVETQVGGSGKAFAKTTEGQIMLFKDSLEDTARELAEGLMPAIRLLMDGLRGVAKVIGPVVDGVTGLFEILGKLHKDAEDAAGGFDLLGTAAAFLVHPIAGVVKGLNELHDLTDDPKAFFKDTSGFFQGYMTQSSAVANQTALEVGRSFRHIDTSLETTGGKVVTFAGLTGEKLREWETGTRDAFNGVRGALGELSGKANVTAGQIERSFQKQLDRMNDYRDNWTDLVRRGLPDDLAMQLQEMGLEGAAVVEGLANANDKQFDRIVRKWERGGSKSKGLAGVIRNDLTKAVDRLTEAIENIPGFKNTKITADTEPAKAHLNAWLDSLKNANITVDVRANAYLIGGGKAHGGTQHHGGWAGDQKPHRGPLKADEVPAILQTGEYVLNRRQARGMRPLLDYHTGGSVNYDLSPVNTVINQAVAANKKAAAEAKASANVGGGGTAAVRKFAPALFGAFPGLQNWGVTNVRNIAGTNTWSQHAYGNAIDVSKPGYPASLDPVAAWIRANSDQYNVRNMIFRSMQGGNHFNHIHTDFNPPWGGTPPGAPLAHQGAYVQRGGSAVLQSGESVLPRGKAAVTVNIHGDVYAQDASAFAEKVERALYASTRRRAGV